MYGVDKLLHEGWGGQYEYSSAAWALGFSQHDILTDVPLSGAADPAEVLNDSHGNYVTSDDDPEATGEDNLVSSYGLATAEPSGNSPTQIASPCIAYDVICAGASTYADRGIAAFSSRGPSPGGRKKPDLVAIGASTVGTDPFHSGYVTVADQDWQQSGHGLDTGDNGTSFSAPQVASGQVLLSAAGISDPVAQKAILIDSARPGRKTPSSPLGTQTTWQPDWGWGELDLDAAYGQKSNFYTASVPGGGVRLFLRPAQANDRATLVWNRRAIGCLLPGCTTRAMTLTNLDLSEVPAAGGAELAASRSRIDNVEQIRAPRPGFDVLKVKAVTGVDGLAAEPFALAATHQIYPLDNPAPQVSVSIARRRLGKGQRTRVTAVVRNPSAQVTGTGATATLALPRALVIARGGGARTRSLGTLAAGKSRKLTWTVSGARTALATIRIDAGASAYGERFTGRGTQGVLVDTTGPRTKLTLKHRGRGVSLRWRASDRLSGVASYDVQVSRNRHRYRALLARTHRRGLAHRTRGGFYRFRVRARDKLGNAGRWVVRAVRTRA